MVTGGGEEYLADKLLVGRGNTVGFREIGNQRQQGEEVVAAKATVRRGWSVEDLSACTSEVLAESAVDVAESNHVADGVVGVGAWWQEEYKN